MITGLRRGSGRPLVLLHTLGTDHRMWDPVLDRLAAERDVLALDLPGFGGSPPRRRRGSPAALAPRSRGLLAARGIERPHVAGNSLGGWVALEMAAAGRAASVTAIAPGRAVVAAAGAQARDRRARSRACCSRCSRRCCARGRGRRLALGGHGRAAGADPAGGRAAARARVRHGAGLPRRQRRDAGRPLHGARPAGGAGDARVAGARPAGRGGRGGCRPACAASCCAAAATCRRGTTRSRSRACCSRGARHDVVGQRGRAAGGDGGELGAQPAPARRVDRRRDLGAGVRARGVDRVRARRRRSRAARPARRAGHDLGPAARRSPARAQAARAPRGPALRRVARAPRRPLPARQPGHRLPAPGRAGLDRLAAGAGRGRSGDPLGWLDWAGAAVWAVGLVLRGGRRPPARALQGRRRRTAAR